jgi:hypothetical protein
MASSIVDELVAAGWKPAEPRPGGRQRAEHARRGGSRVVAEQRGDSLWLVIDEPSDRRVLGIEPAAEPAEVAAAIVALQDTVSIASYFSAYGDLGAVGAVSIIAWEQFDPDWS